MVSDGGVGSVDLLMVSGLSMLCLPCHRPLQTVQYSEDSENKRNVQHRLPTFDHLVIPTRGRRSFTGGHEAPLDFKGCKKTFSKIKLLIPERNCYFHTILLKLFKFVVDSGGTETQSCFQCESPSFTLSTPP